jgi:hypothetical protein
MKTLYESILDDEDVLISNIKKDAKDPFITLSSLYLKYKNVHKIPEDKMNDVMHMIFKRLSDNEKYDFRYNILTSDNTIWVKIKGKSVYFDSFSIKLFKNKISINFEEEFIDAYYNNIFKTLRSLIEDNKFTKDYMGISFYRNI